MPTRQLSCDKALEVFGRNNPSPYTVKGRPVYVHVHGLAIVCLQEAMQARRRSRQCSTDVKFPRLSHRRTTRLHQRALWCSHLGGCGVYRHRMRWRTALQNAARVGIDGPLPLVSFSP
jgi:hypothetical protein